MRASAAAASSGATPWGAPIDRRTSGSATSAPSSNSAVRTASATARPVASSRSYAAATRPKAGIDVVGNRAGSNPVNRCGATDARRPSISRATCAGSSGRPFTHSRGHARSRTTTGAARCSERLHEPPQAGVRERAGDVTEHLDGAHPRDDTRGPPFAVRRGIRRRSSSPRRHDERDTERPRRAPPRPSRSRVRAAAGRAGGRARPRPHPRGRSRRPRRSDTHDRVRAARQGRGGEHRLVAELGDEHRARDATRPARRSSAAAGADAAAVARSSLPRWARRARRPRRVRRRPPPGRRSVHSANARNRTPPPIPSARSRQRRAEPGRPRPPTGASSRRRRGRRPRAPARAGGARRGPSATSWVLSPSSATKTIPRAARSWVMRSPGAALRAPGSQACPRPRTRRSVRSKVSPTRDPGRPSGCRGTSVSNDRRGATPLLLPGAR
ncbi:MAG: hypothetical protein KatS3mg009_3032 [Acidimicrobiia bacterium]|nr:MAG: hypothetical protein KatS3mg009_3032 [Acidimicrobiia bacterium]